MKTEFTGLEVWEVQIGGEEALYIGTINEVQKKAMDHPNYLHGGKKKEGYPISRMTLVGTLVG